MQHYSPQFTEVAPYYDRLMSSVPYRKWVDYLESLLNMLQYKPRTILDLACGTGNVTFELARRGYQMAGVDASPHMIEVAKNKRALRGPSVEFHVADVRALSLPGHYDLATCLYDSLNYILKPEDLGQAFERIRDCVIEGGHFIFDLNSIYSLEQELFTQNNLAWAKTLRYDWRSRYNRETRISEVRMQFTVRDEEGETKEFNELHYERGYDLDQVERLLRDAGWEVAHVFDAYTTQRPGPDSERWYFVARNT